MQAQNSAELGTAARYQEELIERARREFPKHVAVGFVRWLLQPMPPHSQPSPREAALHEVRQQLMSDEAIEAATKVIESCEKPGEATVCLAIKCALHEVSP